jgi:hypothetical protein
MSGIVHGWDHRIAGRARCGEPHRCELDMSSNEELIDCVKCLAVGPRPRDIKHVESMLDDSLEALDKYIQSLPIGPEWAQIVSTVLIQNRLIEIERTLTYLFQAKNDSHSWESTKKNISE